MSDRDPPFEEIERLAQGIARRIDHALPPRHFFLLFLTTPRFLTHVTSMDAKSCVHLMTEWLHRQANDGFESTDLSDACWTCGSKTQGVEIYGVLRRVRLCVTCYQTATLKGRE